MSQRSWSRCCNPKYNDLNKRPSKFSFKDLRKTDATLLKGQNCSTKLISGILGHTNTDTTELYMVQNSEHLVPAEALDNIVESL